MSTLDAHCADAKKFLDVLFLHYVVKVNNYLRYDPERTMWIISHILFYYGCDTPFVLI